MSQALTRMEDEDNADEDLPMEGDSSASDEGPMLPGMEALLERNLEGELHLDAPRVGMVVADKWELTRALGSGGFGQVFEAWHIDLEQKFAIKFLAARHREAKIRQRFLEEARLMAALRSDRLVRVSDYGELADGTPYFVMALVKGRTLRHRLRDPMSISRAVEIGGEILEGLSDVHARDIVHGDIKPENIILGDGDDKVYLLDFGLARTSALVGDGVGGTPPYMAPEVLGGGAQASTRSDVYAVGVVLYEMLTGRLPRGHRGMDLEKMRRSWDKKPTADPVRMHRQDVPKVLDELVMKALSREPTARPRSARTLLEDLQVLLERLPPEVLADTLALESGAPRATSELRSTHPIDVVAPRRRWPALLGGLVAVAGMVVVAWAPWQSTPSNTEASHEVAEAGEHEVSPSPAAQWPEFGSARHGILVAVTDGASDPSEHAYDALCEALGGNRPEVPGVAPVRCHRIPSESVGALVDRAGQAEFDIVVYVGKHIRVRSVLHGFISPLLPKLDGLPIPTDPAVMAMVAPVLTAIVDPVAARGIDIPALEQARVGAQWAVLAELLRYERGHRAHEDLERRSVLEEALNDQFSASRSDSSLRFYRDLGQLVWALTATCNNAERALRALLSRSHEESLGNVARLELAKCLVDGVDVSMSRAEEAALLFGEALAESEDDPCVRVASIGLISRIDQWRGNDELWDANEDLLPHDDACDPQMWSRGFYARGVVLAHLERWCDTAVAFERSYGAQPADLVPLLAWAEYAWKCAPDRDGPHRELLGALRSARDAEGPSPDERLSAAYLAWWLSQDPVDAQGMLDRYRMIDPGNPALVRGVASDIAEEICERAGADPCVHELLARPKQSSDEQRLRDRLGLH